MAVRAGPATLGGMRFNGDPSFDDPVRLVWFVANEKGAFVFVQE